MKILVSNDDGYLATGINVLTEALQAVADVVVVAPDRNRSAASNSLTVHSPLRVHRVAENRYSVDGTPSDCVHLALTGFLKDEPDLVVSGINHGANLGDDVIYSGTVAAAMEGRFLGLPTIAAHLFVAYFGVLSVITPPVALAAFAAAPIAGAGPMETGVEAVRLAIAGFIIPFVFVYHQDVLIIVDDFALGGLLWAVVAFVLSTWAIATGLSGYDAARLAHWERALRFIVGLAALLPNYVLAGPAMLAVLALTGFHRIAAKKIRAA